MADIELVIKIPEEEYEEIKYFGNIIDESRDCIESRILNGTLLPKGHGRLGDLSKIYVELNDAQVEGTVEYKGLGEAKQIVCNAPTIIEAEREEEE